ncbi:unnamed protein product [Cuscuta campestris]|uniref:Uncharacterized protein n=1 Tax=Cuscuta campestris TaxID=132261 RepID=A0A484MC18_9ASTE|nr:unnamed protein product [Cuscuta campestris]
MRRASSSALTLLRRRPLPSLISSSASAAAASQFQTHLKHFTQTPPFLSRDANKPRMFSTQTPPPYSEDVLKAGMDDLQMGMKLHREGKPEKALPFATRALQSFYIDKDSISMPLAVALHLMGSVSSALELFDESIGYLNWAKLVLGQLEISGSVQHSGVEHAVELDLVELGNDYRNLASEHFSALKVREALPLCMKALEIHRALLGDDSVEVAKDREVLGLIYGGLKDLDKALEQYQLSLKVLKNLGHGEELLEIEIEAAKTQVQLGRYDEAIDALKGVLPLTDKDNRDRAMIYVAISNALSGQKKLEEAKKCLDTACEVLGKDESSFPYGVATACMEIGMLYQAMNALEDALSVFNKTLRMFEKMPDALNYAGSVSCIIEEILLATGKAEQAVPYLEDAVKWLKESYGSNHFTVGCAYKTLGTAYLELDRPQSAAKVSADAKDIFDASLGPHHAHSIKANQNLSKAHAAMESYELAIDFQKKVVEALEGKGSNEENKLQKARQILEQLKKKRARLNPDEEGQSL